MPLLSALFAPVREFFTLRRAERTVRAYLPGQQAKAKALCDAAAVRLLAGRRTLQAVPASLLLRDALAIYLRAYEASQAASPEDPEDTDDHRLAPLMPPVPADSAAPHTQPADDARVRAAFLVRDRFYFDRLPDDELERTRWALDRTCGVARRRVELRSVVHLRGLQWGRIAAVLLVTVYAVFAYVHARYAPVNVALGKPVHPSSRKAGEPDGHDLVDGDIGTGHAMATNTEDNPSVVIDLQAEYPIDEVRVHNRVDGWFDECLPLVVELSTDGVHYDEAGRREEHFDADPPWVVGTRGRVARFVRVRVMRRSYLALSEVEVFSRPRKR
jgi:hypothetical protein